MAHPLMHTYGRLPVAFSHGRGAWLWDGDGNAYLDALSGIAVCGLGHAHPRVTEALREQAGQLLHTSNLYQVPLQEELAAALCRRAGMDGVFFCNSGAEANEAAIKLARLHGSRRGIASPRILVMDGAFHGRTLGTLAATGNDRAREGFGPLPEGFERIPYDDLGAVDEAAGREDIVAVLVEPIQGEGGIREPHPGYLEGLRARCDDNGWLLMLDEIQTGNGRTGAWLACQHEHVVPDVVTLAKGLGNGVPIGACLARGEAADTLGPGSHGSTFGGNPLAASAALAVIRALDEDDLIARAGRLGTRMRDGFHHALDDEPAVKAIRGRGLMLGIELDRPCTELVQQALDQGLLINVTAQSVVRLLPPLVLTDEDADRIVEQVSGLIQGLVHDTRY
ncbi:acetylornithine transaminase [Aquisalimonas lutea]|uniref:acetylornithine transaminase n=1 Tax=Aquisalimonas lutea TaxID=1327750 RepID=UPI0025B410D4|nr:acetylornithine transaminase [Aquisalimonas lutea]MDN3517785.1 acetylornithine transaminase [Aquisalimonas lutea]